MLLLTRIKEYVPSIASWSVGCRWREDHLCLFCPSVLRAPNYKSLEISCAIRQGGGALSIGRDPRLAGSSVRIHPMSRAVNRIWSYPIFWCFIGGKLDAALCLAQTQKTRRLYTQRGNSFGLEVRLLVFCSLLILASWITGFLFRMPVVIVHP